MLSWFLSSNSLLTSFLTLVPVTTFLLVLLASTLIFLATLCEISRNQVRDSGPARCLSQFGHFKYFFSATRPSDSDLYVL